MRKTMLILLLFLLMFSVSAQENVRELSLKQALELAQENNSTIKSARSKEDIAKAELTQSMAAFFPVVEFSMMGVRTTDPLNSFGFKLKQEIVTQADFNPDLLNDPGEMNHFSSKLELKLPVFNLDALYSHKAAKLNAKVNTYKTERSVQYIFFEVKKMYYSLNLTRNVVEVIKEAQQMAESALQLTENNQKQGYAKEADVLMAKVRLADVKAKLIEAQNRQSQTEDYFNFLLGLETGTVVIPTDKLGNDSFPEMIKDVSLESRSDVMAFKSGVQARKQMLNAQKTKFIPRFNAFANAEWNDKEVLGTSGKNYTIGGMLSWKLFNGFMNIGGVQKAKAQLNNTEIEYKAYLQQNQLEMDRAKRDLTLAFEQIKLSELSKTQAAESHRIIKNRYAQGLEKTVDLLYAENLASSRKLEYLQSLYKYKVAVSYLELLYEQNL